MEFNKVIIIESAEETLCTRLTELRFDPETGNKYHLTTNPPPDDEAVRPIVHVYSLMETSRLTPHEPDIADLILLHRSKSD